MTRRTTGGGSAAYVSTRLGVDGLVPLLPRLLEPAGVGSELPVRVRGLVETVVRRSPGGRFLFLVNRTDEPVTVPDLAGEVLVGNEGDHGTLVLPPRGVAVVRRSTA
ncbi:Beta-galactosidase C-terminal domain [Streptomyces sp. NPDC088387]|uniref:Beta-galactosidase C-terminal domain n=1 Tax=Streptomyces sp. NPDC088387 TaxID=3365859 RepID=UPI0037F53D5C